MSSARPGNLPTALSPLIGREREVDATSAILRRPETRLLTLTGPGGVGKTRLALQAAADAVVSFPDGAWFVSLAAIVDPDLVTSTVATTLDIRAAGDRPIADRLRAHLREKRLLLVLDNFEQLLPAAPFVADLLASCPDLTVLVTSRSRLRVSGEHEYAVAPLRVTRLQQPVAGEDAQASDAMRLFAARAQAVKGAFALTAENAAAIAEICARLDGLPLAIELAAAWVKVLSPQALLTRLERRLPLLTGGNRDLPARQRTMRDTIAWSHELLSPEEQILFRRLAVFAGGCTLEAAEWVAGSQGGEETGWQGDRKNTSPVTLPPRDLVTLELLASLVDKSLLQWREESSIEARYSMLETVREFALEQLVASGEADAVAERHAAFFLSFVERMAQAASGIRWPRYLDAAAENFNPIVAIQRVAPEHDNVRLALDRFVARGQAEAALRLTIACDPFWESRGHYREAAVRLDRVLAIAGTDPTPLRAQALYMAGDFAFTMGNLDAASTYAQEALAISSSLDDPRYRACALHIMALVEENRLHWGRAAEMFEATLEMWRRLDEPTMVATTLCLLGGVAYGQGELDRAIALEEEAFSLYQTAGHLLGEAMTVWYQGLFAASRGEMLDAARRYQFCLTVIASIDDVEYLFKPLVGLAAVAAHLGHFETSARLLGAADESLRRTGGHLFPFDRPAYEEADAAARATLGEEQFTVAFRAGGDLTLEQLLAEADAVVAATADEARQPRRRGAAPSSRLTRRESEILQLLAEGKTDREIAETLFVSRRTVNAHVASIRGQLGVHSRKDAIDRARALGLLPAPPDSSRYT